jgi:hypothetical protein
MPRYPVQWAPMKHERLDIALHVQIMILYELSGRLGLKGANSVSLQKYPPLCITVIVDFILFYSLSPLLPLFLYTRLLFTSMVLTAYTCIGAL